MRRTRPARKAKKVVKPSLLMVRLDAESKRYLTRAAELRQMSRSDYVRAVTIAQARREVLAARGDVLVMTPEEQLAFWNALSQTPKLTGAQRRLGSMMRGES
jgi:uncharacterized protein (DUF1778 family)